MPAGVSIAQTHTVFRERVKDLCQKAQAAEAATRGAGDREWFIPAGLTAEDLFDIASLHLPAFDREAVNENYVKCFQDDAAPGTTGDVISLKQQIDYNAAEERAFRLRHASTVRCLVHAAGRRWGEGVGPSFRYVEDTVADAIGAGAAE